MGNRLSCLRWGRNSDVGDAPATPASHYEAFRTFDMLQEGCVALAPNPMHNRTLPITMPQCLLTSQSFYALQQFLPPLTQSMKLELVFSTWEHGFSRVALQNQVTAAMESSNGRQANDLLMLVKPSVIRRPASVPVRHNEGEDNNATSSAAGGATVALPPAEAEVNAPLRVPHDVLIGVYIPQGLTIGGPRRYYGTDGTFLFDPLSVDRATSVLERYCPVASPRANEYYVSTPALGEMLIAVGGGGNGAAISIDSGLEEVRCSTHCPTFDAARYWSLLPSSDRNWNVEGVTWEGGEPLAALAELEIWRFSNERVTFPHLS